MPPPSWKGLPSCYSSDMWVFRTSLEFPTSTPFPLPGSHTKSQETCVLLPAQPLQGAVRPRARLVLHEMKDLDSMAQRCHIMSVSQLFLRDGQQDF